MVYSFWFMVLTTERGGQVMNPSVNCSNERKLFVGSSMRLIQPGNLCNSYQNNKL